MVVKLSEQAYKDKVKACWIGKNIGGTMGGPYEQSRCVLNVTDFVTPKGEPLPNDDLDLQLCWLLALESLGPNGINAESLGEFWLSYIHPHWNEYGVCKANMKMGIPSQVAGDYKNKWLNSNGAFIRSEVWACVCPALPELAVKYALSDGCVDHGSGEGTIAEAFVAALQSSAFVLSLNDSINVALAYIPENSRTAQSIRLVREYYETGKTWLEARNAVLEQNKDIGDGWFESPSNVAYAVIGMLYGEGDFKKSMLTAINCGDDTDCTAATVGATFGILYGTKNIPADWIDHVGDKIVTISLAQGCSGSYMPKTLQDLTNRVVEACKSVLYSHNAFFQTGKRQNNFVYLDSKTNVPEDIYDWLLARAEKVKPTLAVKPLTYSISNHLFKVSATLSKTTIKEDETIDLTVEISQNPAYDSSHYSLAFRWWLPDGFAVEGNKSTYLGSVADYKYGKPAVETFKITTAKTEPINRLVLEISTPGRPTVTYLPITLLG